MERVGLPVGHSDRDLSQETALSDTPESFVSDLDRITREETDAHAITERIAPLLGRLVESRGARERPSYSRGSPAVLP